MDAELRVVAGDFESGESTVIYLPCKVTRVVEGQGAKVVVSVNVNHEECELEVPASAVFRLGKPALPIELVPCAG